MQLSHSFKLLMIVCELQYESQNILIAYGSRIYQPFCSTTLKALDMPQISALNIFFHFGLNQLFCSYHPFSVLSFFHTTATPVLLLSSFDPSHQRFKLAIPVFASRITLFLFSIMSFPRKRDLNTARIGLVPLAGSILNLTDTCRASRWPYVVICWLLTHIASCSGWSSGCIVYFHRPLVKVMGRISLVGIESGRLKRRQAYLRCWKSSNIYAGVRADSLISAAMGVLKYIPVIERACRLINFCTSFWWFFWFFHHVSAPYK